MRWAAPTGVSAGIGFAIPSDIADAITKQLISGGKVARGYLGVTIASVTPEIAESLGLSSRQGAYINEVTPGGPAAQGGLQVGDIVVRMNGQPVKDNLDLTRRVGMARAGETIRLEVMRNGRLVPLSVRSGLRPSESELAARARPGAPDERAAPPVQPRGSALAGTPFIGGLSVAPLDAAARQRYGIPNATTGVVITDVARGTEAARAGFRPGDVITRVDNQAVSSPAEARAIADRLRAAGRPSALLLAQREGNNIPVPLALTPTTPAPAAPSTPQRNPSPDAADKTTQPKPRNR